MGVTIIEFIPGVSYPARIGERNELQVTYSEKEFLRLTKAFDRAKASGTVGLNELENAIQAPLERL